jgi:cobalt-zinc-cadmium efflux system outer membrane protein
MSHTAPSKRLIAVICTSLLFAACAKEKYQPNPIDQQQTTAKIFAKGPLSADFKVYLIKQGYNESELPFTSWGLHEMTLSALYHHPKLDIAKAQLALANAQLDSAGQKQNPTLSGSIARSDQANEDIRPWAYGLNVEIPIETAGKRDIRVEQAQHLQEIARIDVADTAWQLRSQIAKDLLRYHENIARQKLLQQQIDKQTDIVNMLEKRVAVGMLSNTDVLSSKILLQANKAAYDAERAASQEIQVSLAADAGLSLEKFNQIPIKPLEIDATLAIQTQPFTSDTHKNLQEKALLNRLDIRRGLEKYAAAEARIKLEVAKQTPDISISPGFIFEFGDKIWSLGFSSLLNLLNKNQTLIAEATQLREIEGAQFEVLQSNVISSLGQVQARLTAAQQNHIKAKQQQDAQQAYLQKLNKQFAAGALDKLELTQAMLQSQLVDAQVLATQFEALRIANELEDLLQIPLIQQQAPFDNILSKN